MDPFSMFNWSTKDINILLPYVKTRLMSEYTQTTIAEKLLQFLEQLEESERNIVIEKLITFDIIHTMCDVIQTSDEDFVKIILECLEIISAHKIFYENQTAIQVIQTLCRLSYFVNKSLKDIRLFQKLLESISNILVRSLKLYAIFDTDCIFEQIVLLTRNVNIEDLQKNKLKFSVATMFNVVLQKQNFDENIDAEIIIDVCHDILKSMTKILKHGNDDETIVLAANALCSTCASSSRFCIFMQDSREKMRTETDLKIYEKKNDLEICVNYTMMNLVLPYLKDKDLVHSDLIELGFCRSFVICLEYLYQLEKNCNKDNLSKLLAADGYLKRLLYLRAQFPATLQRSTCRLLSRILSILGKTAFSIDTAEFADILYEGLLALPTDSTKWNDAAARKKDGSALIILLYYHFLGTQEKNDMLSLEFLTARVIKLPTSTPISVLILKPLWLLFAVTSLSHPRPDSICRYENAVDRMTSILQHSEISEFYTHHTDLLRFCLTCPYILQDLLKRVLNLWLIESDGDIKPLSFNYTKVGQHLLDLIQPGYSDCIINVALKGLQHFVQIIQDDRQFMDQFVDIVWQTLPDILSSYQPNAIVPRVTHVETALELASIIPPSTTPLQYIIRCADNIIKIILKRNTKLKFITLVVTQAYTLLNVTVSRNSFEVLEMYVENYRLLRWLYRNGFSKERSELSTICIKLLSFVICCQKKSSVKCEKPLTISVQNLCELLTYARLSSQNCTENAMQLIYELLTPNDDGSAVVLQNITTETHNVYLINLYEILYLIHAQMHPISHIEKIVYQSLVTLLHFCNTKAAAIMPYICTTMSTYNHIKGLNLKRLPRHFDEFILTWLHYYQTYGDKFDGVVLHFKSPLDEALEKLKEYLIVLKKEKLKDVYLKLQRAVSYIIFRLF
ncbi:PREDICTED: uncharacterized protein LOC105451161 [Wasmannia auropunctata]|uniref:uncharacterized protein LOC105451161 n=1 Tax=Wasmannia auropunctata TaxID=64793 RepID=UPI0005EF01E4|nr:PREDICTED: uncharacterized protein LOC105451161 [Wasmannia auropunctata]